MTPRNVIFERRPSAIPVSLAAPFLISTAGPLWFQKVDLDEVEQSDIALKQLLMTMVFNKPISCCQSLSRYRDLEFYRDGSGLRANMIGLYTQLFSDPKQLGYNYAVPIIGNKGAAYLLTSGPLCSVFADSVGAAKRFCLEVFDHLNLRQVLSEGGMAQFVAEAMEKLRSTD